MTTTINKTTGVGPTEVITHEHCYICWETKTTGGCGCGRVRANEEAREVFREVMNDNGMISADFRGHRT